MENYLIEELENNRKLNILFLSHNSYWEDLQSLDKRFSNLNVHAYGESVDYLFFSQRKEPFTEDVDLIILYTLDFFSEEELDKLKDLAFDIAYKKDKRVSLGYSYRLSKGEKSYGSSAFFGVKVISYTKKSEREENMNGTEDFSPQDLASITLATEDAIVKEESNPFVSTRSPKLVKKYVDMTYGSVELPFK